MKGTVTWSDGGETDIEAVSPHINFEFTAQHSEDNLSHQLTLTIDKATLEYDTGELVELNLEDKPFYTWAYGIILDQLGFASDVQNIKVAS